MNTSFAVLYLIKQDRYVQMFRNTVKYHFNMVEEYQRKYTHKFQCIRMSKCNTFRIDFNAFTDISE